VGCDGYDLRNTVTHEAGHFVGLAHPCGDPSGPSCQQSPPAGEVPYSDRTMYPTTSAGQISKRTLSVDDVAGVCAIYPPASGCGCGTSGAPGVLAAALAALALLAARPRRRVR
jgi:MYXO-CTERM domain-containing protein